MSTPEHESWIINPADSTIRTPSLEHRFTEAANLYANFMEKVLASNLKGDRVSRLIHTTRHAEFHKISEELFTISDDLLWNIFWDERQDIEHQLSSAYRTVKTDFELRNAPYEITYGDTSISPYESQQKFTKHYLELIQEDAQDGVPPAWIAYGLICSDFREEVTKMDENLIRTILR